jgi:hypothetical protein
MEEKLKMIQELREKQNITTGMKKTPFKPDNSGSMWRAAGASKDEGLRNYGDVVMNRLNKQKASKPPAPSSNQKPKLNLQQQTPTSSASKNVQDEFVPGLAVR